MEELATLPKTVEHENMDVTLACSVDAFFHELVAEALHEVNIDASEPAGWYLVNLLGEFTRCRLTDDALGVKLVEPSVDAAARLRKLKEVGDTSLYVAGYFTESLSRSMVDVEYYVGLGQSAYGQLARQLCTSSNAGGGSISEVYAELAERFPAFVDVLMMVRRRIDYSTTDVGKLYEIWLRTRDEWVEKRLRQAGLIVGSPDAGLKVIQ